MQRRLRQFLCAVKEHSTVSYAKLATVGGFCDLDLIIVKTTVPDDLPISERYIQELLKIFSISPTSFHVFSIGFTRRFSRTHCWRVALKCLLLFHHLLRSLPECSLLRRELLWARASGLLSLYPCHFRDYSSSNPEEYIIFIRSYAQLLDEALDYGSNCLENSSCDQDEMGEEVPVVSFHERIKEPETTLQVLRQLQSLMDRAVDCRPQGAASRSFIVQVAMKHIICYSLFCYTTFRRKVAAVLDNLIQMPYGSCILALGIYKKGALQANQLSIFYGWCKDKGFCGSYEYPIIDEYPKVLIFVGT